MKINEQFHTLEGQDLIIGWLILILLCCVICMVVMWITGRVNAVLVMDIMKRVDAEQEVRVLDDETNRIIYAGQLNEADEEIIMRIVDRIAPVDDIIYLHTR